MCIRISNLGVSRWLIPLAAPQVVDNLQAMQGQGWVSVSKVTEAETLNEDGKTESTFTAVPLLEKVDPEPEPEDAISPRGGATLHRHPTSM
jgi:hypothetical protein